MEEKEKKLWIKGSQLGCRCQSILQGDREYTLNDRVSLSTSIPSQLPPVYLNKPTTPTPRHYHATTMPPHKTTATATATLQSHPTKPQPPHKTTATPPRHSHTTTSRGISLGPLFGGAVMFLTVGKELVSNVSHQRVRRVAVRQK